MLKLLYIFVGGGLGAVSRFGLSSGVQSLAEHTRLHRFPLGILACNLLGCFAIGAVFAWISAHDNQHSLWLHPLVVTGFLGGFTTFSTFALDTNNLITPSPALALWNIALSVIGSLVAVWLGFKCFAR